MSWTYLCTEGREMTLMSILRNWTFALCGKIQKGESCPPTHIDQDFCDWSIIWSALPAARSGCTPRTPLFGHGCSPPGRRWSSGLPAVWGGPPAAPRSGSSQRWQCAGLRGCEPAGSAQPGRQLPPLAGAAGAPEPVTLHRRPRSLASENPSQMNIMTGRIPEYSN